MRKEKLGAKTFLYPMPTVLVGANVKGKANYITVAYCGIVQHSPAMLAIALGKTHYTNAGIKENGTFSVNIPSEEMLQITDYVGIYSGKSIDKANLFENFYGLLSTAPMIKECALNLECKLVQTVDVGGINDIFIGQIMESYAEEQYLTQGLPDIEKMKPIIFSMHDNHYWRIGEQLGQAWSIGRDYRPEPRNGS